MTTNNLTKQWRKGELEQGWYYVKNEFGNIFISEYSKDYDFIGERVISGFFIEVPEIIEIICEVPSYEQWKSLNEILDSSLQTNKALTHRLNLCKDLLKECNHMILAYSINHDTFPKEKVKDIVTKIERVLK